MRSSQPVDADLLGLRGHPLDRQQRLAREPPAAERRSPASAAGPGEQQQRRAPAARTPRRGRSDSRHDEHLAARRGGRPARRARGSAGRPRPGSTVDEPRRRPASASARAPRAATMPPASRRSLAVGEQHAAAGVEHLGGGRRAGRTVLLYVEEVLRARRPRSPRAIWPPRWPRRRGRPPACRSDRSCRTRNAPEHADDRRPAARAYQAVSRTRIGSLTRAPARSPTPRTVRMSCGRRALELLAQVADVDVDDVRRARRRARPRPARAAPRARRRCPARRARNSSTSNSRARELDLLRRRASRRACRASMRRSPTSQHRRAARTGPRRISARRRASSSPKSNGLTR